MQERESKQEYEDTWNQLRGWVEECVQDGTTDVATIVRQISLRETATHPASVRLRDYIPDSAPGDMISVHDGKYCALPIPSEHPEIFDKLAEYVAAHDINVVVEMGSGTGRNLFLLRERVDAARMQFHACEYTAAGREVCAKLADIGGVTNLSVHAFDYRTPDLSFLSGKDRVLFFSVHSVEQVTTIPDRLIEEMLQRCATCVAVHFEPVGWQADPQLLAWRERAERSKDLGSRAYWKARRAVDTVLGTRLARGFREIPLSDVRVGASDKTSLNAARWSAAHGYNKNFLQVLDRAQGRGAIEILERKLHYFGSCGFNPSTLIAWKKGGPR